MAASRPAIILPDADLDWRSPAPRTRSSSITASAAAPARGSYAHKSVYDESSRASRSIAGKIKVGPGLDPATEMGPLVSDEQFARVTGYIEDGRPRGAQVAVGGDRVGNLGYFVAPTVLENTNPT